MCAFLGFGRLSGWDKTCPSIGSVHAVIGRSNVELREGEIDVRRRKAAASWALQRHQRNLHLPVPEEYPKARIELLDETFPSKIRLPDEFAEQIAAHSNDKMATAGTLCVPSTWATDDNAGELQPWLSSKQDIKTLCPMHDGQEARLLYAVHGLLVVEDGGAPLTIPASPAAAHAWVYAYTAVDALLKAAGDEACRAWDEGVEAEFGWFAYQQAAFRIQDAIQRGEADVVLGGKEAPIFLIDGMPRSGNPFGQQVRVQWPTMMSSGDWWRHVAKRKMLKRPDASRPRSFGIGWEKFPNVICQSEDDMGGLGTFLKTESGVTVAHLTVEQMAGMVPQTIEPEIAPPAKKASKKAAPPPTSTAASTESGSVQTTEPVEEVTSNVEKGVTQSEPEAQQASAQADQAETVQAESVTPEETETVQAESPATEKAAASAKKKDSPKEPASKAAPDGNQFHAGGLPEFILGRIVLDAPHSPDFASMALWVDQEPVAEFAQHIERLGTQGVCAQYGLKMDLQHGSLLRMDFEATRGKS